MLSKINLSKLGTAMLAALLALQAGLPSVGLDEPLSNIVSLGVAVVIAFVAVLVPSPITK